MALPILTTNPRVLATFVEEKPPSRVFFRSMLAMTDLLFCSVENRTPNFAPAQDPLKRTRQVSLLGLGVAHHGRLCGELGLEVNAVRLRRGQSARRDDLQPCDALRRGVRITVLGGGADLGPRRTL